MLALRDELDETPGLEPLQVDASCGRCDVGNHRQFGAGARVTVQERIEHPGPRGFTDRGSYGGNRLVRVENIHSLILNEVLMRDNWHSGVYAVARELSGVPPCPWNEEKT
jgi:hypothetical protein